VNLAADHARYFAAPAPPAAALALMTDADQTCGLAEAWYADFAFVAPD
jgi:hypothetical protein